AYSRDGRLIATGVFDRVNLWDAETGRPVANWQCQSGHVNALSFGPGNVLVSAWDDGAVRFWVTPTDRAGPALKAHTGGAFSLALDATGTMLASLGWDGVVRLWDFPTGRLIGSLATTAQRKSDHWGDALGFSPDGRHLAVACSDGTVHVFEVASGYEVFILRG